MAEPDASKTVKGITKLSLDPVSSTNPIAVGDNDPRVNEYNLALLMLNEGSFSAAISYVEGLAGTNVLTVSTIVIPTTETIPTDVILQFEDAGSFAIPNGVTVTIVGEIIYSFDSPLSFDDAFGMELRGNGGGEVQPSSEMRYTGSDSTSAITLKSAYGFHAEAVSFTYTSETFTGFLLETGDSPTAGYGTSAYFSFERCRFEGSETAYRAAAFVSVNNSIISSFTHCRFRFAQKAVKGEQYTPDPVGLSYAVKFDTCTFNDAGVHIWNPAQGWVFINNTFEPIYREDGLNFPDESTGTYKQGDNRVIDGDAGRFMWNLVFSGNWIGDASATPSIYSGIHLIGAFGATISGNLISYPENDPEGGLITCIEMTQCYGVEISGNNITGADQAFSYTTQASFGIVYGANKLNCLRNTPLPVGGITASREIRLGNAGYGDPDDEETLFNNLIKSGLEINDGLGNTLVSTTTGSISLGGVYTTLDTGASSAIRVTAGITDYGNGSLIIQPRTNAFTDIGFHTYSGEQFRVLGTGGVKIGGGSAITKILRGTVTVDPASIAANTVATQTFTLTGAATGDNLVLNPPAAGLTAGLLVLQTQVSAANTISITFMNSTGSAIDESSASWSYLIVR